MEETTPPSILVLGIGNLLWADEGFGVRVVEEFHRHYEVPDTVRVLDGGTQGVYLVQHVREADVLIVFDAIDYGLEPGTMKRVEGDEVPRFLGCRKVSLHQTGFQEVIMMAEMMGDLPHTMVLIGVQPVELDDFGGSLRPQVRDQIEPAIAMAITELEKLGVSVQRRAVPLPEEHGLAGQEMRLSRYEGERPDEREAYRHGDPRIVFSHAPDPA
jgi:hydrogenase maturation protease